MFQVALEGPCSPGLDSVGREGLAWLDLVRPSFAQRCRIFREISRPGKACRVSQNVAILQPVVRPKVLYRNNGRSDVMARGGRVSRHLTLHLEKVPNIQASGSGMLKRSGSSSEFFCSKCLRVSRCFSAQCNCQMNSQSGVIGQQRTAVVVSSN
jgi:hypothetical protein